MKGVKEEHLLREKPWGVYLFDEMGWQWSGQISEYTIDGCGTPGPGTSDMEIGINYAGVAGRSQGATWLTRTFTYNQGFLRNAS